MYGVQCPKRLWLYKNLPKERDVQSSFQRAIFQQGTNVGELARQLFPGGVDASPDNPYSYQKCVADTMRYLKNGHQVIYEAAFQFEGILCALDILVKVDNQWHAFEVKSTTGVKEPHILDTALQYYVITNAGINLADISIIHLNRQYVRQGALDIEQLFTPVSILDKVKAWQPEILLKKDELLSVLAKNIPPGIEVGEHCNIPYPCDFQQFCNQGKSLIEKMVPDKVREFQILKNCKDELTYPVYFLHLDTWNNSIPLFDGHWPYKQVCFQYSIHKLESAESDPAHFYFVSESPRDQGELIEKLLSVLGQNGDIVVHYESFSQFILKEFGKEFILLNPSLQALLTRMKELENPFRKDYLFEKELETTGFEISKKVEMNTFQIRDSRSASAEFFNATFGKAEGSREIILENLKNYAQQSSGQLMHWIIS